MSEPTIILILATSFIVALSGALMPGPLLALTIGGAARRGFWAGPLLVLGHAALELALVIAIVFGLSHFINNPLVLSTVGIIGGIVLLWMGWGMVRKGWRLAGLSVEGNAAGNHTLVISGILASAANPYWLLWWVTIGLTYLLWALKFGWVGVGVFYTSHISADLVWYAAVSFAVARGKRFITGGVYRWFMIICGAALVVLGGYFILSGVQMVR